MTRYFEQAVLIDPDTQRVVIERRYSTGEVEYWSQISIGFHNGQHKGTAGVPFKINIPEAFDIPSGDLMSNEEFSAAMQLACRAAAFANLESSMMQAEEGAKQQVVDEIAKAEKQAKGKIILANAVPRIPIQQ